MSKESISRGIPEAREAIADIAVPTPVVSSPILGERVGADVVLKLENLQVTGSFKVRGAALRMLALTEDEKARGVVTCSSGNHGRAVAYVAERLGIAATIVVPNWIDRTKLEAIKRHGAETILHGDSYDEAEARSLEVKRERELAFVSPFDHPRVIAGQGTIGLELAEQVPRLDAVLVPIGGGGLISGIALALKSRNPQVKIVGVSARASCVMMQSVEAGRVLVLPEDPTIANAIAGGIGVENRYTFDLVRELVDEHVAVSEEQIRAAMAFAAREHNIVVEGGGAVGIAALLFGEWKPDVQNVAVVVSGGNVDAQVLAQILAEASETG